MQKKDKFALGRMLCEVDDQFLGRPALDLFHFLVQLDEAGLQIQVALFGFFFSSLGFFDEFLVGVSFGR